MTKENIKIFFNEGINYLQFQIDLLAEDNEQLKDYTYMQYIKKNAPLIVNELVSNTLRKADFSQKITKLSDIFTNIKEYIQVKTKDIEKNQLYRIENLQDIFRDYTDMLSNNLDSFDLHETFKGWTEDGTIYNTRADDKIISSHTAGIETLLATHFSEELDHFTWQLADLLDDFLQIAQYSKNDEKLQLNKELITRLINTENVFNIGDQESFLYKNSYGNIWDITIRKEEEKYEPFKFALEGRKIGTNATWSRRYIGIKEALLHIINNFNENASIKNKYSNIEDYLEEKQEDSPRKFDYMMLDRLRSDCDYFLSNGNGYLGYLYYKDIDKHIEEMKEIYNSFSEDEKPEWISLEDIENYKEKMNEKFKEVKFEKQDYKYIIKCDLDSNEATYIDQYLLVENATTPSDLDIDLVGNCCFNCDYEILNPKLVAKIYSLEGVKKFCELNKIDILKNIDKEGNLIIGGSKDQIIANDMNRYDREKIIKLNEEELEENND